MLIIRIGISAGAGLVLVACGQQIPPSSSDGDPQSEGAASTCAAGSDRGKVIDGLELRGSDLAAWLRARADGGYADDQVAAVSAVDRVTACLLSGDFVYPHPSPIDPKDEGDPEPVEAIEFVGVGKEAMIDSIGPASKVEVLWNTLQEYSTPGAK